jgi:hypothetical protein
VYPAKSGLFHPLSVAQSGPSPKCEISLTFKPSAKCPRMSTYTFSGAPPTKIPKFEGKKYNELFDNIIPLLFVTVVLIGQKQNLHRVYTSINP